MKPATPAPAPRNFTHDDIWQGGKLPRLFVQLSELVHAPLPWQRRGLQQTASGYGARLTGEHKIQFEGRLFRIYHTCYGNAGSAWFTCRGVKIFLS